MQKKQRRGKIAGKFGVNRRAFSFEFGKFLLPTRHTYINSWIYNKSICKHILLSEYNEKSCRKKTILLRIECARLKDFCWKFLGAGPFDNARKSKHEHNWKLCTQVTVNSPQDFIVAPNNVEYIKSIIVKCLLDNLPFRNSFTKTLETLGEAFGWLEKLLKDRITSTMAVY